MGCRSLLVASLFALVFASGCKKDPWAGVPGDARAEAKEIFKTRCATCHGATGTGDGAAAAALNPKPRNYHDGAWQKSVTDEQIEKTIVQGGAAVGKSPLMPPNPDLADKPKTVAGLRAIAAWAMHTEQAWQQRLDRLDDYLRELQAPAGTAATAAHSTLATTSTPTTRTTRTSRTSRTSRTTRTPTRGRRRRKERAA